VLIGIRPQSLVGDDPVLRPRGAGLRFV